jgi:6-phospho-3-hexuloisomerase
MGSLFEQSLGILLDVLILYLMESENINAGQMFARHANLE